LSSFPPRRHFPLGSVVDPPVFESPEEGIRTVGGDQVITVSGLVETVAQERVPADLNEVSLTLPDGLSLDAWLKIGRVLRTVERSAMWWIGDWIRYGERRYGRMYEQAMQTTGYSYQTLADAKWVAEQYEISARAEKLSWSHHRVVARVEPAQREEMLRRVAASGLSVRETEAEVSRLRPPSPAQRVERRTPATNFYMLVVELLERRRAELGLTLAKLDELSGVQDGYSAHMLKPNTPTGRQAHWDMLQLLIDVLYPDGIDRIEAIPKGRACVVSQTGKASILAS
jgi:hypothetical protein